MQEEAIQRVFVNLYHITDSNALALLRASASIEGHEKGDIIQEAGTKQNQLLLLINGIVRCYFTNGKNVEMTDCFITRLGYPVMTPDINLPAFMSCEAVTRTELLAIPIETVLPLMETNTQMLWAYNQMLSMALLFHWQLKTGRACFDASERYAWFRKYFPGVDEHASGKHIASFLNMTPETLSRVRKKYTGEDAIPIMIHKWHNFSSDDLFVAMSNGFRNNGKGDDILLEYLNTGI